MSETQSWQDMSDDELLFLHSQGKLPQEAEQAIGSEQLRTVVAWDGMMGERPPLFPTPAKPAGPDYASMSNDDLRAILSARGLDVGGNKAKMVARLEASDAPADEDDEDDDAEASDEDEDDAGGEEPTEEPKAKSKSKKKD
jgi:SAP domain